MHALRTSSRIGFALIAGAFFGVVSTAQAIQNIPNCDPVAAPFGAICNDTVCKLGANIVCLPGQQIVLNGGADLDLSFYSITCATGQDCPTAAVKMNAANSVVKTTGGTEAKITGSWSNGVGCGSFSGSRVTGIRVDGHFTSTAVANCSKVDGNVIVGDAGSQRAVTNNGISDADFIMDNYIDGFWEDRAIGLTGSRQIDVANNIVVTRTVPGTQGYGLVVNSSVLATVTDNIFMGNSGQMPMAIVTPTSSTFSGNLCDPTLAAFNSLYCSGVPKAPFTMP